MAHSLYEICLQEIIVVIFISLQWIFVLINETTIIFWEVLATESLINTFAIIPEPTARKDLTPATTKATTKATTTRPRVTPRPDVVTPRPTVPDICSSTIRYDAVFVGPGKWTYFVVGDRFWLVDRALRRYGPWIITKFYKHIKTPVDAAYLNKLGNVVFFKGSE